MDVWYGVCLLEPRIQAVIETPASCILACFSLSIRLILHHLTMRRRAVHHSRWPSYWFDGSARLRLLFVGWCGARAKRCEPGAHNSASRMLATLCEPGARNSASRALAMRCSHNSSFCRSFGETTTDLLKQRETFSCSLILGCVTTALPVPCPTLVRSCEAGRTGRENILAVAST